MDKLLYRGLPICIADGKTIKSILTWWLGQMMK